MKNFIKKMDEDFNKEKVNAFKKIAINRVSKVYFICKLINSKIFTIPVRVL